MNVKECKWEGLEFNPCDKYAANYEMSENGKTFSMRTGYNNWGHCPYCGANIHKPEGVIIKKSGGTWVAQYNEIDYLWVGKKGYFPENKEIFLDYISNGMYKPISEIEITDEIAKLRPMVVHREIMFMVKLYGVDDDKKIVTVRGWTGDIDNFRLATVVDLS